MNDFSRAVNPLFKFCKFCALVPLFAPKCHRKFLIFDAAYGFLMILCVIWNCYYLQVLNDAAQESASVLAAIGTILSSILGTSYIVLIIIEGRVIRSLFYDLFRKISRVDEKV